MVKERNVSEFNRDVLEHQGYVYSTAEKLSCRLSNGRMTGAIVELGGLEGKRVIDVGCGDGTYSWPLVEAGAKEVVGIDAAEVAIDRARVKFGGVEGLRFEVADICTLEEPKERYDVAVVRGILHHLYDVERAVATICSLAQELVVVEPNGYNPLLKVIEKVSAYHVRHEEKSYRPKQLDRWFERCGGRIERSGYIGLVPFFCPDLLARLCKRIEPLIEATPLLRRICCAQYVQRIRIG